VREEPANICLKLPNLHPQARAWCRWRQARGTAWR
jgi:hypothetical protein